MRKRLIVGVIFAVTVAVSCDFFRLFPYFLIQFKLRFHVSLSIPLVLGIFEDILIVRGSFFPRTLFFSSHLKYHSLSFLKKKSLEQFFFQFLKDFVFIIRLSRKMSFSLFRFSKNSFTRRSLRPSPYHFGCHRSQRQNQIQLRLKKTLIGTNCPIKIC